MTNREKFKQTYGFEADCGSVCTPFPCHENNCRWWKECEGQPGCPCDGWWDMEYEQPEAAESDLRDYWNALTDRQFLKANYGINDIDMQFLHYFTPEHVVRDWREMRKETTEYGKRFDGNNG